MTHIKTVSTMKMKEAIKEELNFIFEGETYDISSGDEIAPINVFNEKHDAYMTLIWVLDNQDKEVIIA